jgi:phosphoribosyl 1,2-cyclic phosphodiesterase
VNVVLWGTRGSLPTPGPETVRYGGNTACVEVRVRDDHIVVFDAGTGIRRLGATLGPEVRRVDVLLTHLHMDHIVGLGFFDALHRQDLDVHIWGPASATLDLGARLTRYLSAPLFPVGMRDLACDLTLHDLPMGGLDVPDVTLRAALVCHPGLTLGYRLEHNDGVVTYLSDHEPALGATNFPESPEWTSGFDLAHGADLLIHDAQYDDAEYRERVGWGHSTIGDAIAFATLTRVRHLVAFHHDPTHDDATIDGLYAGVRDNRDNGFELTVAVEGACFDLPRTVPR